MAIARDAQTSAGLTLTTASANITCAASAVLFVGTRGSVGYATGVTHDGVAMTRISDVTSGVGEYNLSLWYLLNPATGSKSIAATVAAGSVGFWAESYTGADTTSQPDNSTTNTGSGTNLTTTITTIADNCWVIGHFGSSANTLTAGTGTNFLFGQVNNTDLGDSGGPKTPAGNYSMDVTAGSGTFAAQLASIRPPGGAVNHNLLLMGVGT